VVTATGVRMTGGPSPDRSTRAVIGLVGGGFRCNAVASPG
jgi:hypothetical protein